MSFIGSLFNGAQGAGYQAQGTNIQAPTTDASAQQAQAQAQSGIGQQQAFVNALQSQNGIGNQNQVYNQLQGVANGTGPNPAAAQLAQATSANVANQAALMAGQRGAGANPALIARQAAMQGGALQQNAAGQAATMQANQSLNALGQLGTIAGQQVNNQQTGLNALNSTVQGNQGQLLNSIQGQNQSNVGMQSNINSANAGVAGQNAQAQGQLLGGVLSGVGSAAALSDERLKQDIRPADDKIKNMLDQLGAHEYSYSPQAKGMPGVTPGSHTSPMAQELQKSEVGSQMVVNTPQGKVVDYAKGMGTMLAAQATLNKRLEALEGGKKMASGGFVSPSFGSGPSGGLGQGMSGLISGSAQGLQNLFTPAPGSPLADSAMAQAQAQSPMLGGAIPQTAAPSLGVNTTLPQAAIGTMPALQMPQLGAQYASKPLAQGGSVSGPKSVFGMHLKGMAEGGAVKAMLSPGEVYIPPQKMPQIAQGADPISQGTKVPGKAKVKGNSYQNDVIPAKLEEGGIVLPKSVMEDKNPHWAAHKFVQAIMAKRGLVK